MLTWNVMLVNGMEFEVEAENWAEAFKLAGDQANELAAEHENEDDFENNQFDLDQLSPDPHVIKSLQTLFHYLDGNNLTQLREMFGFNSKNQPRRDF